MEEAANTPTRRGPLAIAEGNLASAVSLWPSFGKRTCQVKEEQESRSQAVSQLTATVPLWALLVTFGGGGGISS